MVQQPIPSGFEIAGNLLDKLKNISGVDHIEINNILNVLNFHIWLNFMNLEKGFFQKLKFANCQTKFYCHLSPNLLQRKTLSHPPPLSPFLLPLPICLPSPLPLPPSLPSFSFPHFFWTLCRERQEQCHLCLF